MSEGKNLGDLQTQNRSTVLRLLRVREGVSRRDLARLSGLTPSTITYIVKDLIHKGIVEESGQFTGSKGRRAIALRINPDSRYVVGVRVARNYIACGLFDLDATLITSERVEIGSSTQVEDAIRVMKGMIWRRLGDADVASKTVAIGVGAPGPLSVVDGTITFVSNFPGWRDVPIREIVQREFNIETVVEHDAHAAALAEKWFGIGKSVENLVYVAAGRGVGAGIIMDGRIYHGSSSIAGEIGHTTIDHDGPRCECGNYGCLELYCSSTVVLRKACFAAEREPARTVLSRMQPLTLASISEAVNAGDGVAVDLVKDAARHLGYGVVNLVHIFNPDMVILGDEMAQFGSLWVETVREVVQSRLLPQLARHVKIEGATLTGDPFLVGVGAVAIEHLFRNP